MNSGDMLNPSKKYNLEYYLSLADKIVGMGAHILGKFPALRTTLIKTDSLLRNQGQQVNPTPPYHLSGLRSIRY